MKNKVYYEKSYIMKFKNYFNQKENFLQQPTKGKKLNMKK